MLKNREQLQELRKSASERMIAEKKRIIICAGAGCVSKGALKIYDKFAEIIGIKPGETSADGLFTLDALRCIGACGIAPAVTINGKVYPKLTVDAVPKIVNEYKAMEANN